MISVNNAKRYCCEDISRIENYDIAVASPERWCVHHRKGLEDDMSKEELKGEGLYNKRPASELIFMPLSEHISMHMSGEKNPMYGTTGEKAPWFGRHHTEEEKEKIRQANLGRHFTDEQREKMRQAHLGKHLSDEQRKKISQRQNGEKNCAYGLHWYTDGTRNIRAKTCPEGFAPGFHPSQAYRNKQK